MYIVYWIFFYTVEIFVWVCFLVLQILITLGVVESHDPRTMPANIFHAVHALRLHHIE